MISLFYCLPNCEQALTYVQFNSIAPNGTTANTTARNAQTPPKDYRVFGVELYDSQGKKLASRQTSTGSLRLETANLPKGLYHVNITQDKKVSRQNLSIER